MSGPRASEVATVAARRAVSVPGVARLDAGPLGTRVTYGPGGRVEGVTVSTGDGSTEVVVHAAVRFGDPIPPLGERVAHDVTEALSAAFPGRHFTATLHVTDVVTPGDVDGEPQADGPVAALPPAPARRQLQ